ncbi:MAG TPA: protein kinase [Acidimicrobiales bacterium]|nr:protein kinase [Acidimicrobiales bacterium]
MSEEVSSVTGAAPAELTGHLLAGRYRLTSRIATGGMAQVWEADDEVLARPVAVKLLHSHLAADQAFVDRFRHEAISAARLSHPSIVSIYDTVSDDGVEAIVMELVRGTTLRSRLDRVGTLEVPEAVAAGAQVSDALEVAHRALVVHRDIKPANILLNRDGRVMVADFGIAKALQAGDHTAEGTMLGTAKYLAPEQVEGTPVDGRTDIYSLGVVLYEALCGRPPFREENDAATALARLYRAPLRPRQLRAGIPKAVDEVIMRSLAVKPEERFASAADFRASLLASLDGRAPEVLPPPAPSLAPPPGAPRRPIAPPRVNGQHADARPTLANIPAPMVVPGSATPPPHPPSAEPAAPTATPSFGRTERSWILPAVLIVLIAVALGVAGVLLSRSGSTKSPLTNGAASGPVKLAAAATYDPPPGDGTEGVDHGADAAKLIDGNAGTTWSTDRYHPPRNTFGNIKSGVGVYVSADQVTSLQQLAVQSSDSGWSASVYVADNPPPAENTPLTYWGNPVAEKSGLSSGRTSFDLHGTRGKVVLLWITRLPDSGQLTLGELQATS